jgi:xanthine phosphoribosyltransferase
MKNLVRRLRADSRYLGNGIVKVDGFINHQVDSALMYECGFELSKLFDRYRPDIILTAETSGILSALTTSLAMSCPMIYARKKKPITMAGDPYVAKTLSHTKGEEVTFNVSREFLKSKQRVLIIDDFLARGLTMLALNDIIQQAGAQLIGIGVLVEKNYEGGRELLSSLRVPIKSLAKIDINNNQLVIK